MKNMETIKHHKTTVVHSSNRIFATDNIVICINNASFGALKLLGEDIRKLKNLAVKNKTDNIISQAYADLLTNLEQKYNEAVNGEKNEEK